MEERCDPPMNHWSKNNEFMGWNDVVSFFVAKESFV